MFDLRVLSLGGGVQSTAMALLADAGELGGVKPDVALFADTGWEPPHVYETVQALGEMLGFPVETVSNGRNLADDTAAGVNEHGRFTAVPVFLDVNGRKDMGQRQCTSQYKIRPLEAEMRRRLGCQPGERVRPGTRVEQWLGISTDEVLRAKPHRRKYITNRWPLIEHNWSRTDCARWLAAEHPALPVGKSACMGCPYHAASTWREYALQYPTKFQETVKVDEQLRNNPKIGKAYLHRSRLPLAEAIALDLNTPSLFDEACEGHCGV